MTALLAAVYVAGIFPWAVVSYYWYPWLPPTRSTRALGAAVQAPIWPLALLVWWRLMGRGSGEDQ